MAGQSQGEKSQGEEASPRFLIKGQYIKDLSFENPHSPHSLIASEDKPKIEVSVDLKAQRFDEQHFELIMHLAARAMGPNSTLFLVELDYGAIVQLMGIPEDHIEPLLFIDCAAILFPFARRVLADVTRDGGFPPMMLEPIDFRTLYAHNKQQAASGK